MSNKNQDPSNCTHDCSSCGSNCSARKAPEKVSPRKDSKIGKTIAVISGKGGVGKTMISCLISTCLRRKEYSVSILDADVTGPSVPKNFGLDSMCMMSEDGGIIPVDTKTGIKAVSVNLMLEDKTSPVIWRGPVIAGSLLQFYTDTLWGDTDYLVIDCPPGTGDVPLTIFQQIKIDGIIIVTTPQDLVSLIVSKAINMAQMMNIPILGIVENMSYIKCPDCDKKIELFGPSKAKIISREYDIPLLTQLPLDPNLVLASDNGEIEDYDIKDYFDSVVKAIENA